jgi:hypothetical protein
MKRILLVLLTVGIAAALFIGCTAGQTSLTGTASKGPIANATVTAYELGSDGTRGAEIAVTTTDGNGSYTIAVGNYAGAVEVVVTGGSYTDEATGEEVTLSSGVELNTLLASVTNGQEVAVTALTSIAAELADENASDGLSTAIENANKAVAEEFGLGPDFDIAGVQPADLTQSGSANDQGKYGAVLAGISQVAQSNGLTAEQVLDLVSAMEQDFTDGTFDGYNAANEALDTALSLTPEQAANGLNTAIEAFLLGAQNGSGLSWSDFIFAF